MQYNTMQYNTMGEKYDEKFIKIDINESNDQDTECTRIKQPEIKISTITLSTKLPDCEINLINVGKYLDIDEDILGIKYNYGSCNILKGKYCTSNYKKSKNKKIEKINKILFYNQVSLILNNNGNNVNVKLFKNGSLHLTGCKSIQEGNVVTNKIYLKLKTLSHKTDTILLTKDSNGIFLDKDNLVYSLVEKNIIGYCKNYETDEYVIHKKECNIDKRTGMFVTKGLENNIQSVLYNLDGEYIGDFYIKLVKNRNKLYKRKGVCFDLDNLVVCYNDSIIGEIVYDINSDKITPISNNDIVELDYSCNAFTNKNYVFDIVQSIDLNVNCMNVYFNVNFNINRQRFYEKLILSNYICKYNPESYSGVRLTYKLSLFVQECIDKQIDEIMMQSIPGICPCTNKCTCLNITFLIFQSGNVIATGFKNNEQIKFATKNFIDICNMLKQDIKRRENLLIS